MQSECKRHGKMQVIRLCYEIKCAHCGKIIARKVIEQALCGNNMVTVER